jgi:hypothetical protein
MQKTSIKKHPAGRIDSSTKMALQTYKRKYLPAPRSRPIRMAHKQLRGCSHPKVSLTSTHTELLICMIILAGVQLHIGCVLVLATLHVQTLQGILGPSYDARD